METIRGLGLKLWSPDPQLQHHLETCGKGTFSGSTPDLLNKKLRKRCPAIWVFNKLSRRFLCVPKLEEHCQGRNARLGTGCSESVGRGGISMMRSASEDHAG